MLGLRRSQVDLYERLDLQPEATDREIKQAYRKMSVKYHPDKSSGNEVSTRPPAIRPHALPVVAALVLRWCAELVLACVPFLQKKFQEVTEAYEILSDKEKRVVYDFNGIGAVKKMGQGDQVSARKRALSHRGSAHRLRRPPLLTWAPASLALPQGGGASPFDMFFGGGGQQRGQAQRGRNMDIELPVTLEDLYVGNEKAATVKRRVVCRNCKGKAQLPRCQACGPCPKEKKMVHKRAGPGMVVQQEVMVDSKEKCKREEKTLEATIEKGMPDNEEISFKYESEQKPGQIPGDVVLKLKTVTHPMFKRSRDALSMKLTIPLRAALLGFETSFKHLDGHTVTIKRTGVTRPGQAIRIKGEGMPKHGTPSEFGDLTITFTVDFPSKVEPELASGLEKLLPAFDASDLRINPP